MKKINNFLIFLEFRKMIKNKYLLLILEKRDFRNLSSKIN